MPSLYQTSSQGRPPLLGLPGLPLIYLMPPCSIPPLRSRHSPGLLTLSFSPVIAGLPCCNPEFAPPGSPFGGCVTTLDALSPLMLLCWICLLFYTPLGNYTTLLNSPAWSLPVC